MSLNQSNFILRDFIIAAGGEEYRFTPNHLTYLRYTEDISSAAIRIEAQITDSETGIISELQGMEPIIVGWEDQKENFITFNGIIYDIQDRTNKEGKSKATILCCTADLMNNAATKLSKRFGPGGGKKISDIVEKEILTDVLYTTYDITAEPTQNKFSFVSPYWSPFTIIKWLCTKSISGSSGSGQNASCGYTFYLNKRGYQFQSFDSFSTQEPVKKIVVGHNPDESEEEDDKMIIPVQSMQVTTSSDILKGMNMGSFNSRVMSLDVKDMKYEEHPFNINKYYTSVPLLNPSYSPPEYFKKFDRDNASTRIMSKIMDSALFTEGKYTQGLTAQLSQAALREKLFYNKCVEVEYIGLLDLTVGDVVELLSFKGKAREVDGANSCMYVVGIVERQFISQNDNMSTKLTLSTDSPGIVIQR